MKLMESILRHREAGKALLAANFYNTETLQAVLRAAAAVKCEVILQTSPSTLEYLGIPVAAAMARATADLLGVRAWLHLDHATDPGMIRQCLEAGYDSVMIDASEKALAENERITRQIVEEAHRHGAAVEAELGYIPKLGQKEVTTEGFTDPDQAAAFVAATGVDLLAVAIGTAHGFYRGEPKLDFERLSAIRRRVEVPLVLHGGSQLLPEVWREAIRRGVCKINFATDIKDTFMRSLKATLTASNEIDLRKVFPKATQAATALVAEKLRICGGEITEKGLKP